MSQDGTDVVDDIQTRKRPAPEPAPSTEHTRKRNKVACDTCRARRTKCDNAKPACSYCVKLSVECRYPDAALTPASRIEVELASINQRLSQITGLITVSKPEGVNGFGKSPQVRDEHFDAIDNTPFMLLGTDSMMRVLGFGEDFVRELLRTERLAPVPSIGGSRLFFVRQQQALSALAAFSEKVHIWYPVLRPGFTEEYIRVISGHLSNSSESCLVLLVAAIGCVAQSDMDVRPVNGRLDQTYFEAAMTSLPTVLSECTVISIQCVILLAMYYACLMKPCQAHDYSLIASFKIQNLFKCMSDDRDSATYGQLKQVFWVALLLESELSIQFDMAKSGIWTLDESVELPDTRKTWHFAPEAVSPATASTSPASALSSGSTSADTAQSYFLAEIAMRRMLHRCNSAIRRLPSGRFVYAPNIATELELQLEEWYHCLPDLIRFDTNTRSSAHSSLPPPPALENFLRVQYFCCKLSIYWPAVYQAIEDNSADQAHIEHCEKYFNSYVQLVPSILAAFQECIVHRWTLFTSIFITTMATLKAFKTPCLQALRIANLYECFAMVMRLDDSMTRSSPTLSVFYQRLKERLAVEYSMTVS